MTYAEVILRVGVGDEEAAESALLELGATGTSRDCGAPEGSAAGDVFWPGDADAPERDSTDTPTLVEVVGYFGPDSIPERNRVLACFAGLRAALRPFRDGSPVSAGGPLRDAVPEVRVRLRPVRDWAAETRRSFAPFQPVAGLTVAPPWDRPPRVDGSLIVLNPGAAFGLGTHATTRSCLTLMPPAPRGLAPALDVGTGTGILAIRAAQLGYAPVFGCDIDPVAAAAAGENVRGNAMDDRVAVMAGTLAAVRARARFALLLANIFLNPLLELAEDLARHLESDGRLIASGLFFEDVPTVVERFARAGLRLESQRIDEQWAALRFAPGRSRPAETSLDPAGMAP
jgi:ribosomal protein L11 methyltransferase